MCHCDFYKCCYTVASSVATVLTPSHGGTSKPWWYAIQHIPVPVPSQEKLGGLRQEGHPASKWETMEVGRSLVWMGWRPTRWLVCTTLLSSLASVSPEDFFWHWLTQMGPEKGRKMVVAWCLHPKSRQWICDKEIVKDSTKIQAKRVKSAAAYWPRVDNDPQFCTTLYTSLVTELRFYVQLTDVSRIITFLERRAPDVHFSG